MPEIRELPEGIWRKIAAGEVVERPASAVKELVENSLDAGANSIKVKLWDGGKFRIIVEDNGCGISFEELPLALMYHATSKISAIEDLEKIITLGYRGEALASLVSVADVEIRSKTQNSESGGLIKASDGRITEHVKTNCNSGTRIQIENLFANFPARRKFLKTASGELRRAAIFLREYAVCNPEVSFSLEHDGKKIFETDGAGNKKKILNKFWGAGAEIQNVNVSEGHIKLECWFQQRPELKNSRSDIMSFVNGRTVNDPVIKGAVTQAARELAGNWALFFSLEPSLVDVNIHPTKSEVRFRYPGEIFDVIKKAADNLGSPPPILEHLKRKPFFKTINDNFKVKNNFDNSAFKSDFRNSKDDSKSDKFDDIYEEEFLEHNNDFQTEKFSHQNAQDSINQENSQKIFNENISDNISRQGVQDSNNQENISDDISHQNGQNSINQEYSQKIFNEIILDDISNDISRQSVQNSNVNFIGQTSKGYLIFDVPEGLILMDPHAAHERINYERIKNLAEKSQNIQKLLMPIVLTPTLAMEVTEFKEPLEKSGFEFETSTKGIVLKSVPSISVEKFEPEILLRITIGALKNHHNGNIQDILWRTWATTACKESVKLTNQISRVEALELWQNICKCNQPFLCPHGRPTILKLTNQELTTHFGRE